MSDLPRQQGTAVAPTTEQCTLKSILKVHPPKTVMLPHLEKVLILVSAVSLPVEAQVAEHLSVHKLWTLRGANGEAFLNVMGIAAAGDGTIIVSDKLANALVRVDGKGHISKRLQMKGITPGAVNGPGLVAVSDRLVAAADFASDRIQLLTLALSPVAEIRAVGPVFSLTFDGEGCLWVGAMGGFGTETLFRYSREGNELLRRTGQAALGTVFDDMFHLASVGSRIYQVYITRNVLEQWDITGNARGTTTVSGFPSKVLPARDTSDGAREKRTPPGVLFAACTASEDGHLYVLAGDAAPHPRRDVFKISTTGEILSVITLPERSSTIRVVAQGRLFVVEKGKTQLTCYLMKTER